MRASSVRQKPDNPHHRHTFSHLPACTTRGQAKNVSVPIMIIIIAHRKSLLPVLLPQSKQVGGGPHLIE